MKRVPVCDETAAGLSMTLGNGFLAPGDWRHTFFLTKKDTNSVFYKLLNVCFFVPPNIIFHLLELIEKENQVLCLACETALCFLFGPSIQAANRELACALAGSANGPRGYSCQVGRGRGGRQ